MQTTFVSGNIKIIVNDDDFINSFNQALQQNENTKTFMVNDWGEDWVSTIDVEDKTNEWIWQPL